MPRVHVYRPQRTSIDELEAISVAREPLIEEILAPLRSWEPGDSRQSHLVIGPRGIGKTHLLRILAHRIATDPRLAARWRAVALAEESYGITRVSDLFVEVLRLLAEETTDAALTRAYGRVRFETDEARALDVTLDALREDGQRTGRGLLLMVENLNRVLEKQIGRRSEIHLLRKILSGEEGLCAIGTSPTYLNAVSRPEEPLFEFFRVHLLADLSPEEQAELFRRLAELDDNQTVLDRFPRYRSRLRSLYHFTGGNPRLAVLLYQLVGDHAITDVQDELDHLLDELTPFYQDRMRDLAPQEAKLLEAMALMPEGTTPTELAREARLPAKLTRSLLTRLERGGYVRREARRKKRTIYVIPQRFFRIWHQMSHSRAGRGRLRYLLEFFTSWYATRDERDEVWDDLLSKLERGQRAGEEHEVRDAASFMIGSPRAIAGLIASLDDPNHLVRVSSAAALARLGDRRGMAALFGSSPEAPLWAAEGEQGAGGPGGGGRVARGPVALADLFEEVRILRPSVRSVILEGLLRAAFATGDPPVIRNAVQLVEEGFEDGPLIVRPFAAALEFLDSGRDLAVLERQQPEMREAVELLVDSIGVAGPQAEG